MINDLTPKPPNSSKNFIINSLIHLENELQVKDDFIDIFDNVLQNTDKTIRIRYLSADNSIYYNEIDAASKFVKKYGISKIFHLKKTINNLNVFGGIFGLGDSLIKVTIALGVFVSTGSFITGFSMAISWISTILTISIAILWIILITLSKSENTVKEVLKILVVSRSTLKSNPHTAFSKNRLMATYIWDHALCTNTSETIRGFLILLLIKAISKKLFSRIKTKLIRHTPMYLSKYSEGKSKLDFFLYIFKKSFS